MIAQDLNFFQALISRNFGYDLSKMAKLAKQDIERLKINIKLLPGHQTRFLNLIARINEVKNISRIHLRK